jgi:homoserine dehydrogenase
MFYGQGAGGAPTASAVMGDVVSVARRLVAGGPGRRQPANSVLPALPIGMVRTRYSIGMDVVDEPGVLSRIASVFAEHGVSIDTMRQTAAPEDRGTGGAKLRFITHTGQEAALAATVGDVAKLDVVTAITSVLRVEGN